MAKVAESVSSANRPPPMVVAPQPKETVHKSCCSAFCQKPPEEIRGTILNKGESYWNTTIKCGWILVSASFIQLLIYTITYGFVGQYRVPLLLLPVRHNVILWFFVMFCLDLLVLMIVKLGKCIDNRFGTTKKVDKYFIIFATSILAFSFFVSIVYPVYGTTNLMTKIKGTVIENNTVCMPARDAFVQAGNDWGAMRELRSICRRHIRCIEQCRDFRSMYFWFYGTYILTVFRLFILIILWDIVSFLCMVMDLREENITYTINMSGGYHV